jgi:hypothetical protein
MIVYRKVFKIDFLQRWVILCIEQPNTFDILIKNLCSDLQRNTTPNPPGFECNPSTFAEGSDSEWWGSLAA